jgi:hypothetical protein
LISYRYLLPKGISPHFIVLASAIANFDLSYLTNFPMNFPIWVIRYGELPIDKEAKHTRTFYHSKIFYVNISQNGNVEREWNGVPRLPGSKTSGKRFTKAME